MRRCVTLEYLDDVPEDLLDEEVQTGSPLDYVSQARDADLLGMLFWCDLVGCMRRARLTGLEAKVMTAYMRGYSDRQIAGALNMLAGEEHYSGQAICNLRYGARKKLQNLSDIGVATVLVELFGLRNVRRSLSERRLEELNLA